jgi:hypothetical protein
MKKSVLNAQALYRAQVEQARRLIYRKPYNWSMNPGEIFQEELKEEKKKLRKRGR